MPSALSNIAMAALSGLAVANNYSIDAATRTFRDTDNRAVIFHGMNVVYKLPPYIPETEVFNWDLSLSDEDLQLMRSWGVNMIRLGVMWESVERSPGVYDMDYLNKISALIAKVAEYEIAVIVDNHQDLFSRTLCGEGVPYFYTPANVEHRCPFTLLARAFRLADECIPIADLGLRYDPNGNPLIEDCAKQDFMQMYTAPEVASAFSALYTNQDGLLDKMLDFWTVVATHFANDPNVIGYDILNEPWAANLYHESSLFF